MAERTSVTFEIEETVVFKKPAALTSGYCPLCQTIVELISPQFFASVTGASEREIFRMIEAGLLFSVESDVLRVCLYCLENKRRKTCEGEIQFIPPAHS
jgi:hypothetical protein